MRAGRTPRGGRRPRRGGAPVGLRRRQSSRRGRGPRGPGTRRAPRRARGRLGRRTRAAGVAGGRSRGHRYGAVCWPFPPLVRSTAPVAAILRTHHGGGVPEFRTFKAEHRLARAAGGAYHGVTRGGGLVGAFARTRVAGPAVIAALASAISLWVPAAAGADTEPAFTYGPVVVGDAFVGSTLVVAATWTGDPVPTVKYAWGRCPPTSYTCKKIDHADAVQYTVTAADLGYRLAVQVELKNKKDTITASTPVTAVVTAAAPPPPAPSPSPDSGPSGPPPLVPIAPSVTTAPSASKAPPPTLMRPFPVVRIRGYFARNGARITLLAVRGPRSAQISVRCLGLGCPVATLALPSAPARLHPFQRFLPPAPPAPPPPLPPFERFLPAGRRLEIRVAKPGRIGKYASFVIRAHRAPMRSDRCLLPGRSRPTRCPAS